MKKNSVSRPLAYLAIAISLLLNSFSLKAQTDALDLCTSGVQGCSTSDIEIQVNSDTSVVLRNILGYRRITIGSCDKKYEFCGDNDNICGNNESGKFHIFFKSGGFNIVVKKLSFLIIDNASLADVSGVQFKYNNTPVSHSETTITNGTRYKCIENTTGFDSVVITCNYNSTITVDDPLLVLDSLLVTTEPTSPLPAITTSGTIDALCYNTEAQNATLVYSATTNAPDSYSIDWDATANAAGLADQGNTTFTFLSGGGDLNTIVITASTPVGTYNGTLTTRNAYQCTKMQTVTVTVNALPSAPSAPDPQTVCSGKTVADLSATPPSGSVVKWYTAESGGTALSETNALTSGIYYAESVTSSGNCPGSTRTPVTVNVIAIPSVPTATNPQTFCSGKTVADLTATPPSGSVVKWYTAESGGTALSETNALTSGIYYAESVTSSGNCPGSSRIPVNVTLVDCPPEVVCVMDISGSMKRDFNGDYNMPEEQWRITYAKTALKAFAEILYSNSSDAHYGLASFKHPSSVEPCRAYINYPTDNIITSFIYSSEIEPVINGLTPGGGTPLLAGLDSARKMFQTVDLNENKAIILLSDGAHNCPSLSNITSNSIYIDLMNQLITKKIKVYTIAFGQAGEVNPVLLSDIATKTGGEFYDVTSNSDPNIKVVLDPSVTPASAWDAGHALDIAYSHVLDDGLDIDYTADPMGIINKNAVGQFDVPVSGLETRLTFFITWVTSQPDYLRVKIKASDGTELPVNNPDVTFIHRNNYTIITVADNYLNRPGIVGTNPWSLELDGSGINTESEKFQYLVFNKSSKLRFKTWFDRDWYYTGDKMKIFLEILEDNKRLTDLDKVLINGSMPAEGLGNVMAHKHVTINQLNELKKTELENLTKVTNELAVRDNLNEKQKKELLKINTNSLLDNISQNSLKAKLIEMENKGILSRRNKINNLQFYDNGTFGDEIAGDGLYTTIVEKITKEGTYIFNITAIDTDQSKTIRRETQVQKYIKVKVRPQRFVKKIVRADTTIAGEKVYNLYLRLKDRHGNIPSPYSLGDVNLSYDKGRMIGAVMANPDGSFTQMISIPENIKPSDVKVTMRIYDQEGVKRLKSRVPWWIYTGGICIASVLTYFSVKK